MTVLRSGSASDVGRVRSVNEDHVLDNATLFAVADGMGGHAGGEVASRLAVDTLEQDFGREPSADGLVNAVRHANQAVFERSRNEPDLRGMGTTLTAAALVETDDGDKLVLVNVGDSRAYRYTEGDLEQLTEDHSVAEELVARGELSEAEAAVHPQRHILTRALGVAPEVDVDAWELQPERGERYLLCSDGLSNEVSPDRIMNVLASTNDPQRAAETLVRMANEHGGNDNVTVVLIDVVGDDDGSTTNSSTEISEPVVAQDMSRKTRAGDDGADHALSSQQRPTTATAAPVYEGADVSGSQSSSLGDAGRGIYATAVSGNLAQTGSPSATSALTGVQPLTNTVSVHAPTEQPSDRRDRGRRRGPRRITFRSVIFVLLVAGVAYGAYALVEWYSQNSYFVQVDHGELVVYQGRPGGFLWTHPKELKRTGVPVLQVPNQYWGALRSGVEESSYGAAVQYVNRLQQYEASLQGGATPSPSVPPPPSSTTAASPLYPSADPRAHRHEHTPGQTTRQSWQAGEV